MNVTNYVPPSALTRSSRTCNPAMHGSLDMQCVPQSYTLHVDNTRQVSFQWRKKCGRSSLHKLVKIYADQLTAEQSDSYIATFKMCLWRKNNLYHLKY